MRRKVGDPLEKAIEKRVTDWALAHGWLVEKVKFTASGYPDRIYFGYGRCVLIEFKRPGYEPEPLQRHRINELSARSIAVTWTDNADAAISYLQAAMDTCKEPSWASKNTRRKLNPRN